MVLSNCHTHTVYCDGKNTAEEMICSAIEKGFCSIGISSHSPVKGGCDWSMQIDDIEKYVSEINLLKEKYKDKIQVYCGIKLDNNYEGVDLSKFDYSIGSVHQFRKNDVIYDVDYSGEKLQELTEKLFDGDWNRMAKEYFDLLADFVIANDVDVVGHFDLITKYNENDNQFSTCNEQYKTAATDAIDRILEVKKDLIFEVNTGAMSRCGNKLPYPAAFIIEYLKKKGARITVTGDSHSADTLDYGYSVASQLCKDCGFSESYILYNDTFVPIEL